MACLQAAAQPAVSAHSRQPRLPRVPYPRNSAVPVPHDECRLRLSVEDAGHGVLAVGDDVLRLWECDEWQCGVHYVAVGQYGVLHYYGPVHCHQCDWAFRSQAQNYLHQGILAQAAQYDGDITSHNPSYPILAGHHLRTAGPWQPNAGRHPRPHRLLLHRFSGSRRHRVPDLPRPLQRSLPVSLLLPEHLHRLAIQQQHHHQAHREALRNDLHGIRHGESVGEVLYHCGGAAVGPVVPQELQAAANLPLAAEVCGRVAAYFVAVV